MTAAETRAALARAYLLTPAGSWPDTVQAWDALIDSMPRAWGLRAVRRARAIVAIEHAKGAPTHPSRRP